MEERLLAQLDQILQNPQIESAKQGIENLYFSEIILFKIVGALITIFFAASTLYFMIKTGWLPTRIDRAEDVILKRNLAKRRSTKGWRHVQKHFFQGDDNSLRIAVIEADKILDDALKARGFKGENLGERLKKVNRDEFPNLNDIWEAHKLRNRMVHETDFKMKRDIAERALGVYERTFKELGLID
ncbi:MAG: hypothetical protein HY434_00445 [Candidatus Liptonbacteria bacterium]|nr:hypothetical protein [Candidatus Liptonbacteria bacterium]